MRGFRYCLLTLICLAFTAPAFAADVYGRCVAYDKDTKKVTIIEDKLGWSNPKRPEFTVLPAKEFVLAEDPGAMTPKGGGRLRIDLEKKEIIIYNDKAKSIDTFAVEIISRTDNVEPGNALVAGKTFPVVDKAKKEVTIYSPRQKNVCTIKVPDKYMELAAAAWDNGNDVKITWQEAGKATAFTNLSKAK